jgi:hypothetical protein
MAYKGTLQDEGRLATVFYDCIIRVFAERKVT